MFVPGAAVVAVRGLVAVVMPVAAVVAMRGLVPGWRAGGLARIRAAVLATAMVVVMFVAAIGHWSTPRRP